MITPDPNLDRLRLVADALGDLVREVVFLGGAAVGLLVTDPLASPPRATADIDVIVEVATSIEYTSRLGDELRARGFLEDSSEGAPICRWTLGGVPVDIMPIREDVLGFANRWYGAAMRSAFDLVLASGLRIRVISAPCVVATKLEAFRSRGAGDYLASHDIEDVAAVIDGRASIEDEIALAESEVREFLQAEIGALLGRKAFLDALPGHLPGDPASQARLPSLLRRLRAIAGAR